MGILEKTRALLVSRLGGMVKDVSADARALRDLILELERSRADILRGIEQLRREEEYHVSCGESDKEGTPLATIRGDIAEGEAELKRVMAAIDEAQKTFAAASRGPKGAAKEPRENEGKEAPSAKGAKKTVKPHKK